MSNLAAQIESVQPDVFFKLTSEPYFAAVGIMSIREKRLDSEINKSLAGTGALSTTKYSRPGTKSGATIEVLMPTIKSGEENTPGPICTIEQVFIVKEQPTINLGANGTGLTAEQIAVNIVQTLQGFFLGGPMNALYVSGAFYGPVDMGPGAPFFAIKVTLNATFGMTPLAQTKGPQASAPAQTVTLTDQQPGGGSSVYYTTDGTFPGPGNPTATLYSVPFTVASGTTVRTAAWNGSLAGSMVDTFIVQ